MKKKSRRIGCFFSSNLIGQHIQSQTSLDLTKEKRHLELEDELFFKQQDMYPKKKRESILLIYLEISITYYLYIKYD